MTPPLCRDCRHVDMTSFVSPLCAHPQAIAKAAQIIDLVDGRTEPKITRRCGIMRAWPDACGPEGLLFGPRKQFHTD